MDNAQPDVLAYMTFPKTHWSQIRSTNPLERLNREVAGLESRLAAATPPRQAITRAP